MLKYLVGVCVVLRICLSLRGRFYSFTNTFGWFFTLSLISVVLGMFVWFGFGFATLGPDGMYGYLGLAIGAPALSLYWRRRNNQPEEMDDRVPAERRAASRDYIIEEYQRKRR